ncbi:MAG TPA: hypothetical protein VLA88_06520 [Candidatus Saccharimonadales bacterium]|nr:hypothetical protein [Candidatus Saccharimonadales bacterium]
MASQFSNVSTTVASDPRVKDLMGYVERALTVGVDPAAIAQALPQSVIQSFGPVYDEPGMLGLNMGKAGAAMGEGERALAVVLVYATTINTMIGAFDGIPVTEEPRFFVAIEYHWLLLYGYVLGGVRLGNEAKWISELAKSEEDLAEILNALTDGHAQVSGPTESPWSQRVVVSQMGLEELIKGFTNLVSGLRQSAGLPPLRSIL